MPRITNDNLCTELVRAARAEGQETQAQIDKRVANGEWVWL